MSQHEKSRIDRGAAVIVQVAGPLLKHVLEQQLGDCTSELQWDQVVDKFTKMLEVNLSRHFDLRDILSESNIVNQKGIVNAGIIIPALERMADLVNKPGASEMLRHLANNMRHVFTTLRYLKGE